MSVMDLTASVGLELVQLEAFAVLYENLNDALEQSQARGDAVEARLEELFGEAPDPVVLELVDKTPRASDPGGNFYLGHRASLINAPIEQYPNVSVVADDITPDPLLDFDQGSAYRDRLRIEFMVKSIVGEDEVNKRVQRMLDAINAVMMSNRSLNGVVPEGLTLSRGFIGNVFPREAQTSYGDRWFWQGGRLDYVVTKVGADPSPASGGNFFRGADIGIDQP